ncbi:MAG TPA: SDR family oxidoreductase [Bryobacteraceae bacterium]|nr:SDR family oxidoreductase [Bryobacteraceae bacterium]
MLKALRNFTWQEGAPRMLADYLIVHASMLLALAVSVTYRTYLGHGSEAQQVTGGFQHYYLAFFGVLSPIFPLVFLSQGFYTHSRVYKGRQKVWIVLRGVALALALFFAADFLLFKMQTTARSVALPFALLAGTGLCSARLLKAWLEKRFASPQENAYAKPRRVLVVGGAGYIGSLLVERLLASGCRVRVLDSLVYGAEPLRAVMRHPDFELMIGDCRNIQDVVKAVHGVESIVQLAAIVGDPACEQDHTSALEVNYAATRMLIEIAKGHGVSRVVFASSCSVYGATEFEVDEQSETQPVSFYGRTKVDSERALLAAASDTFHPTILRYATVFGLSARPRFDLVVNLLTAKAAQEGVITIYNGRQWRPFIHVRDLVEATAMVLEAPVSVVGGQILNVGDSRLNYTLASVAEAITEVFPHTQVERVSNSDSRNYRVSFQKIESSLGFHARYSLREGIDELKAAFESGRITDYTDLRYHNQRFLLAAGSPSHKSDVDAQVMAAFSGSLAAQDFSPA